MEQLEITVCDFKLRSTKFYEHDIQLGRIYDTLKSLLDKHVAQQSWHDRKQIGFKTKNENNSSKE